MSHYPPAIAAGTYKIDPNKSRIEFTTTHWFGLGDVQGTFAVASGELTVTDPIENSSVRVAASAASFSTGNPRRDKQVRGKTFLDAERHPEIVFASTSLAFAPASATLYGTLTVKGNEAQLTLAVTDIEAHEATISAKATARIDRHEVGVRALPGIAGRHLDATIHITARFES